MTIVDQLRSRLARSTKDYRHTPNQDLFKQKSSGALNKAIRHLGLGRGIPIDHGHWQGLFNPSADLRIAEEGDPHNFPRSRRLAR
jgi:hypothetical protein